MNEQNNLYGRKEIFEYLKINDDETFIKYLNLGLPAKKILGRWVSSKGKIDEFIKILIESTERSK